MSVAGEIDKGLDLKAKVQELTRERFEYLFPIALREALPAIVAADQAEREIILSEIAEDLVFELYGGEGGEEIVIEAVDVADSIMRSAGIGSA